MVIQVLQVLRRNHVLGKVVAVSDFLEYLNSIKLSHKLLLNLFEHFLLAFVFLTAKAGTSTAQTSYDWIKQQDKQIGLRLLELVLELGNLLLSLVFLDNIYRIFLSDTSFKFVGLALLPGDLFEV